MVPFSEAAASYLKYGGEARYLGKILEYFGDKLVNRITPFDIKQMAEVLYPGRKPTTLNRQALTPARAVMIHAYERGWCSLMRLRRFKSGPRQAKEPASPIWLQLFVRQCDLDSLPHLAALVLFMSHTGARVSEAVRLEWPDVDLSKRRVVLLRTKTNRNSVRFLTDELVARITALQGVDGPVFRYSSRYSINERIAAVCKRANIPYKSPHVCGRHSFATNTLAMGMDVKTAMEAGDWKSSVVFLETYVHSKNAGRLVADRFNSVSFDPIT